MCDWDKYGSFRIDPCIVEELSERIVPHQYKPILSCCGHGKYPKTIVMHNLRTDTVFEWVSNKFLSYGIRPGKKYYKRDKAGYYYIPEISGGVHE